MGVESAQRYPVRNPHITTQLRHVGPGTMKAEESGKMSGPNEEKAEKKVEENRFEMLVTGISDYAIYMLNPEGFIQQLECRSGTVQRV